MILSIYNKIIHHQHVEQRPFLSCTEDQWQAYFKQFDSSIWLNLMSFDIIRWPSIQSILLVLPEFVIFFFITLLLVQFGLQYKLKSSSSLLSLISLSSQRSIVLATALVLFQFTYGVVDSTFIVGLYEINNFTQLAKLGLLLLWLGLQRYVSSLSSHSSQGVAEFPLLSHLVLGFSIVVISVSDFALFLICLEGLSLILYIIATIGRLHGGISAASKYFVFGTAGSVLILWGAIHIYEATSSLSFSKLFYIFGSLQEFSFENNTKIIWASSLVLVGLLVKLGSAPIHQWVPDVYSGVPLFITSFYSIFVKFILYVLFLKLAYYFNSSAEVEYAALLSLAVGCLGTLRQVELKRFLAYGSITHIGFLLTGDLNSSLMYLSSYVLASFAFFSVLLNLKVNNKEVSHLSDLRFLVSNQLERSLLVVSLSSIAGLPPFSGFYGKIIIWSSLIEDIYLYNDIFSNLILILNLSVSLVIIFYYMRLVIILFVGDEQALPSSAIVSNNSSRVISLQTRSTQALLLAILVLWTFLVPKLLEYLTLFSEALSQF